MRRVYDAFERFPDGSTLWRASIIGKFEACRKIQELREHSGNNFFLLDVSTGDCVPTGATQKESGLLAKRAVAR